MRRVRGRTPTASLIAAMLLVSSLLLSSCTSARQPAAQTRTSGPAGSSGAPTTTATVAITVAATPTPSPSATDMRAQVLATVREYFDAANYAIQTGDTTRLKAVTDPGCPCYALVDHIESDRWAGRHAIGAAFRMEKVQLTSLLGNSASVTVLSSLPRYDVVDAEGRHVVTVPAQRGSVDYTLVRFSGSWHVTQSIQLNS